MKKTLIISAIALSFSVATLNAENLTINNSYEVESIEAYGVNSFCTAIAKGDIETVKKLIKLGEDVNRKSKGMTPVMYAAKFNRVEILKLLIANGAKLDQRSDKGMTALKYAEKSNANDTKNLIEKILNKRV